MSKFDENDVASANKEVGDLLVVAHFTPQERARFISMIQKEIKSKGVTLDILK